MNKYLELIDKPRANSVNVGLSSPKLSTLISLFGEPRDNYTGDCQSVTGPFKNRIITQSVGPFKCTGMDVALKSLTDILDSVKNEIPDLYAILGTAGMLCARKVKIKRKDGTLHLGDNPSNHSWGLAIDIKLSGVLDKQSDDKNLSQKGLSVNT